MFTSRWGCSKSKRKSPILGEPTDRGHRRGASYGERRSTVMAYRVTEPGQTESFFSTTSQKSALRPQKISRSGKNVKSALANAEWTVYFRPQPAMAASLPGSVTVARVTLTHLV